VQLDLRRVCTALRLTQTGKRLTLLTRVRFTIGVRLYDYPASCNCYKARLLLAQLGRAYERVPVDIFAGDTLADDYAAMNPARTTPVLETDDGHFLPE
jgi:glutaredoxin